MLDAIGEFLDAAAFTALCTPVSNAELIGFVAGASAVFLLMRVGALIAWRRSMHAAPVS